MSKFLMIADDFTGASDAGVQILAYDCTVTPDSLELRAPVRVQLQL